ncbi:hypothetical protein ACFQE8_00140 [Salinirubellus sp. GCM10025818]|uniref:hypothetical protein n=1 Tax=Salinirubellus TaxID=2162630 RepID=UPI0030D4B939
MSQALNAFKSLSRDQRVRFGSVALVVGIVLIGILGFATVPSEVLRIVIGIVGVIVIVVGTLLLGTSEGTV